MAAVRPVIADGLGPGQTCPTRDVPAAVPPLRHKLFEHREYIRRHGQDLPEIRDWRWGPYVEGETEAPELHA